MEWWSLIFDRFLLQDRTLICSEKPLTDNKKKIFCLFKLYWDILNDFFCKSD
jgi:hypothetical protein